MNNKVINKLIYFKFFFFASTLLFAQKFTLKGHVQNDNSEPLNNAVVQLFIEETFKGFKKTNENGFFLFTDLEQGEYQLKINALNFSQQVEHIVLNKDKDIELFNKLVNSGHFSALEHTAYPVDNTQNYGNFIGWVQLRKTFDNENLRDNRITKK